MRVALLHYSAQPIVGGVEKIMAAHVRLFCDAGHEVKIICRGGEADLLLKGRDPYAELKRGLGGAEVVFAHNVLTMPFDMELTEAVWRISAEEPQKRWIAWIHDLAAVNPHYEYDWNSAPWERLGQACAAFEYVTISPLRARQFPETNGTLSPGDSQRHRSCGSAGANDSSSCLFGKASTDGERFGAGPAIAFAPAEERRIWDRSDRRVEATRKRRGTPRHGCR
jgi:hypothetical protein